MCCNLDRNQDSGGVFKTRRTQSTRCAHGAGSKYIPVGSLLPSLATEGLENTSRTPIA